MNTVTSGTSGTSATDGPAGSTSRLVGAVLLLTVVATLMLLAFAAPAVNSGADDLPLGVSGPPALVTAITAGLEEQRPGAFDVRTYETGEQVAEAVADRQVVGGISVTPAGAAIQLASGAGTPYAALVRALGAGLESTGTSVTYTDLAPLTDDDPTGAGLASLALPLGYAGLALGAVFMLFVANPLSGMATRPA